MSIAARLGLSLVAFAGIALASASAQGEKLATPREVVDPDTAIVRVHLPSPTARAWLQSDSAMGVEVTFRVRNLEAGTFINEPVTGVWRLPNGLLVAQERSVTLVAGKTVDADFRTPGPAAKPKVVPWPSKEVQPPKDEGKKVEGDKKEGAESEKKPDEKKPDEKKSDEKKSDEKKADEKKVE